MEQERVQPTSDAPEALGSASAPVGDTAVDDLDPAIATLMLMTGARVLQHIADNDRDGAVQFIDEVFGEIRRQQRLMRLLELDQNDLERLLQQLEQAPEPASEPPAGANSPARELYSPAERVGATDRNKRKSLRDYVFGG